MGRQNWQRAILGSGGPSNRASSGYGAGFLVFLQPVVEKIHQDMGWWAKTPFMEGLLKAVAIA